MGKLLNIAVCVALLNVGGVRGNDWGSSTADFPGWGDAEKTDDWGGNPNPFILIQSFTGQKPRGTLPFDLYAVRFEAAEGGDLGEKHINIGRLVFSEPGRSTLVIGFHHHCDRGSGVELRLQHRGNSRSHVEIICNNTTLKGTFVPDSSTADRSGSAATGYSVHSILIPARALKSSGNIVGIRLSSKASHSYELRHIEIHAKSGKVSPFNPPTILTLDI